MARWAAVALIVGLPAIMGAQEGTVTGAAADSVIAHGRQYTAWFYGRQYAQLEGVFSPLMRSTLDTAALRGFRQQVDDQLGAEHAVVREDIQGQGPLTIYVRTITVDKIAQAVLVRWVMDAGGGVQGFSVRPEPAATEAPTSFLDYHTKTALRLPFDGQWFVAWGGRTLAQNRHAASPDQRFADDFVIVRDGLTHGGDGHNNSDYYCFGRPVLAPGKGAVVVAFDSVADNVPASTNAAAPLGNHVIIDHGDGEFSFLAHLQRGSVRVKAGDVVVAGQPVGLCGNSGFSTEPHLHYHLQSTPSFLVGAGMPAQFENYTANGKRVDRGEPTRGQVISAP